MSYLLPGIIAVVISGAFGCIIRYFDDDLFIRQHRLRAVIGAIIAGTLFGAVATCFHVWLAEDIRSLVYMWTIFLFWYLVYNPEGTKSVFVGPGHKSNAVHFTIGLGLLAMCMGVGAVTVHVLWL